MTDPAGTHDNEDEPSIGEPDNIHDLIGDAEAATAAFEEELLSASRLYSNDNDTNDDATIDTDVDTAAADAAAVAQGLLLDDAQEADDAEKPSGKRLVLPQSSSILLGEEDSSPSPIRAMQRSTDDSQPSSHYYSVLNATQMILTDEDDANEGNNKNTPRFHNFSAGHSIYSSGTNSQQQQQQDPTGATHNHPLRRRRSRHHDPIAALASGSNRDPPATTRATPPTKPPPPPPQLHSWPLMQRTVLDFWTQTQTKPSPKQLTDASYIRHVYLTMGGRNAWDCYCASFQGTDLHGLKPRDVSIFHHTYLQTLREAQTYSTTRDTVDDSNRSTGSPSRADESPSVLAVIDAQRRQQPQSQSVAVTSSDDDDDDETPIIRGNYKDDNDDLELQRQPQQSEEEEEEEEDFDSSYVDTTMDVSTLTTSFDPAGIGVVHDDSYYYHLYEEQHQQSDEDMAVDSAQNEQNQQARQSQPQLVDDEPVSFSKTTVTAEGAASLVGASEGNTTENGATPSLAAEPRRKDWCRDQVCREWGLVVCLLVACIIVSIIIGVVVPRLKRRSEEE